MLKPVLIFLGFLSLLLGGIGIILPGLPTTPFVLLAAGLFIRSSEKLYMRLLRNRIFGKYIRNYMEKKGLTLKEKVLNILLMCGMISLSVYRIPSLTFRVSVLLLGAMGVMVMIFIIPTVSPADTADDTAEED